jgi:hypothetical protein
MDSWRPGRTFLRSKKCCNLCSNFLLDVYIEVMNNAELRLQSIRKNLSHYSSKRRRASDAEILQYTALQRLLDKGDRILAVCHGSKHPPLVGGTNFEPAEFRRRVNTMDANVNAEPTYVHDFVSGKDRSVQLKYTGVTLRYCPWDTYMNPDSFTLNRPVLMKLRKLMVTGGLLEIVGLLRPKKATMLWWKQMTGMDIRPDIRYSNSTDEQVAQYLIRHIRDLFQIETTRFMRVDASRLILRAI